MFGGHQNGVTNAPSMRPTCGFSYDDDDSAKSTPHRGKA